MTFVDGTTAIGITPGWVLYKLEMATENDLRWLKKEFVLVWKATPTQVKSLPQSNAYEYEQLAIAPSTFEKICFNGNGS